ncbi:ankyrin repeat domain-containing protein 34B-like [Ictidomys tridecemlineatus]
MDEGTKISSDGNSLIKAVHQSRLRLTRLLLEGGAYINESNDLGETPLMIACKTKHVDPQSVSKAKMVKYLLENSADPNIQDKSGKTALMHACLEKAGPEVVSLLLKSGADLSLQDRPGYSALVYAINAEDRETLKVLLSACKAKGKEVIIITTAKSPSGRHTTKQYLNMPPADIDGCHSAATCTTPSEIDIKTASSQLSHFSETELTLFGFKDREACGSSDDTWEPGSPVRKPAVSPNGPKLSQGPAWIKSTPLLKHQNRVASLQEELLDITPEEEFSKTNGLPLSKRFITRHQSIDVKDTAHLLRTFDQAGLRKMSYDEINYQFLFPDGNQPCAEIPVDQDPDPNQTIFTSTLRSIVQKRNSGANHYNSDSQLSEGLIPPTLEYGKAFIGKKKILLPSSSLLSDSKELSETIPPGPLSRRNPAVLERRGSGAFPLDHNIMQTRPGFLPPLNVNPHPPISDINVNNRICSLLSCGQKVLMPTVAIFPKELKSKKKMLLRRQSLQTEQIKQLVNF